jgi:hypothetical protein
MVRAMALLDELKAMNLGLVEIVVERVTVVEFRMSMEVAVVEAVEPSINT